MMKPGGEFLRAFCLQVISDPEIAKRCCGIKTGLYLGHEKLGRAYSIGQCMVRRIPRQVIPLSNGIEPERELFFGGIWENLCQPFFQNRRFLVPHEAVFDHHCVNQREFKRV